MNGYSWPKMLQGVYPTCVTPFTAQGDVDTVSLVRLLVWFKISGCAGVVLGGTNGEGPLLSAVEKRDLVRSARSLCPDLPVIVGLGTNSLSEAVWLAQQSAKAGAIAALVLPPQANGATVTGIQKWFEALANSSPIPLIVYHHPAMTKIDLGRDVILELLKHPNVCGFKWSSGDQSDLGWVSMLPDGKCALMGDETLLAEARQRGWSGTISGASNVLAPWIVRLCDDPSPVNHQLLEPLLRQIRTSPQPATHKSVLVGRGVLACADPRLPLLPASGQAVEDQIVAVLGQL